jgi:hypothetical protein
MRLIPSCLQKYRSDCEIKMSLVTTHVKRNAIINWWSFYLFLYFYLLMFPLKIILLRIMKTKYTVFSIQNTVYKAVMNDSLILQMKKKYLWVDKRFPQYIWEPGLKSRNSLLWDSSCSCHTISNVVVLQRDFIWPKLSMALPGPNLDLAVLASPHQRGVYW